MTTRENQFEIMVKRMHMSYQIPDTKVCLQMLEMGICMEDGG